MPAAEADTRTRIIRATIALIREESDPASISVRRIMVAADANLNSVNYHFRTKQNLLKEAVRTMIVEFLARQPRVAPAGDPLRRLEQVAALPARFLAEEPNVARISILSDLTSPEENDLTMETTRGFLDPLRRLHPEWSEPELLQTAWLLTASIQHVFLRADVFKKLFGLDFFVASDRDKLVDSVITQIVPAPKARRTRR